MFFSYTAIDKEGKEIKGRLESTSRTNAITLLLSKGYTLTDLKEESERNLSFNIFVRVRTKDLVIFSRQIATLFEAEISALRAFNLVAENVQNKYFQNVLRDIAKSVEQGLSVEKAFLKHQHIFGEFFVSIVAVGERSGTLPRSFIYLADYIERYADTIARIRKALTYPIFVIITFFAVVILILTMVIPQIASVLVQSGAELPLITQIVIGVSDFLQNNLLFVLLGLLSAVAVAVLYFRTGEGKKSLDSFVITIPLVGRLVREFYLVRFSDNLNVMLAGGVPIVSALQILGRVMTNYEYKEMVNRVANAVQQGKTLSSALENQYLISKNVSQIIRIGEETGNLQKMLQVITDFYQKQLRQTIDIMLDLIQPLIIVVLGVVVGVLIGSVIVPIYSLSSAL